MTNPLSHILARAKNGAAGAQVPSHTSHIDPATRMRAMAAALRESAQRQQAARQVARSRGGQ